jgi:hypothetical protein
LHEALPKLFKKINSMQNSGCHGNRKEKLKKSSCLKPQGLELRYLAFSTL